MVKKSTCPLGSWPRRVLYIITKSVWGGGAKYVFDLATHLPKGQFEVFVAAGNRDKLAQKIIEAGLPYFEIKNFQRKISFLKEPLALLEILKLIFELKPDIVHVNSSKAGGLVGVAGWLYNIFIFSNKKSRLIFTAHGWAFNEDRPAWQLILIKLFSWLTALFYDQIICVSEYDRKTALENRITPAKKLITIHNGLDFEKISFLSRQEAQQKILGKISPLVIGTIAEWTKNKGLFYLLEAIKGLEDKQIDFVLLGSGENPDKEKMYQFVRKNGLGRVHLIEWLENAAQYLKAFDIFVLPSIKEGLPYTIIEAMLAELAIIATRAGGIPEMIENNVSGLLIEPKNHQQIKKVITYLLNEPEKAKTMGIEAKEKVKRNFGLEKMLDNTLRFY